MKKTLVTANTCEVVTIARLVDTSDTFFIEAKYINTLKTISFSQSVIIGVRKPALIWNRRCKGCHRIWGSSAVTFIDHQKEDKDNSIYFVFWAS